jgi:hypothetical protein
MHLFQDPRILISLDFEIGRIKDLCVPEPEKAH